MAVVGVAPCQCFSPGGNQTTSPIRIFSIGPPHVGPSHTRPIYSAAVLLSAFKRNLNRTIVVGKEVNTGFYFTNHNDARSV